MRAPVLRRSALRVLCGLGAASLLAHAPAQENAPNSLTTEEKAAGWKLLFDGKSAAGLRGVQKSDFLKAGWTVKDGALFLAKDLKKMGKVTGGDLASIESFLDFEFSFEWNLAVSANTGVLYLARPGMGGGLAGCEYQIIDDVHHPEGLKGGLLRRTGALDGIIPTAAEKKLNEPGQWNEGRIVVQGPHVEHWLNGERVVTYELGSPALAAAVKASPKKGVAGVVGSKFRSPVVLLDQGEEVSFRNLKIRTLAPAPAVAAPPNAPVAPGQQPAAPAKPLR